eukprot:gb/GECG01009322.1/.p1 GENE.gb/GECG01009322.1/~~gb/GECG01009322.1/.p1  ORF type:complete len:1822 (+),score=218.11 gb/GECG01009322.1/:1-5466(+)
MMRMAAAYKNNTTITRSLCLFLVILWSILSVSAAETEKEGPQIGHSMNVRVQAQWPTLGKGYGLIAEASEFIADENPRLFWTFVDCINRQRGSSPSKDKRDLLLTAETCANEVTGGLTRRVLRTALDTRAYSAAVEVHRQVTLASPRECPLPVETWLVLRKDVAEGNSHYSTICSLAEITRQNIESVGGEKTSALQGQAQTVLEITEADHTQVLKRADDPTSQQLVTVFLYGTLGTENFHSFYRQVLEVAEQLEDGTGFQLALRHTAGEAAGPAEVTDEARKVYLNDLKQESLWLSGYGVGLDIKNLEYKAMDDKQLNNTGDEVVTENANMGRSGTPREWIGDGFYIEKLNALRPAKKDSTKTEEDSDEQKLAKWKDIGLQTAAHLMASVDDKSLSEEELEDPALTDPLLMLQRVTGNFPLIAERLLRVKVPTQLRREAYWNQNFVAPGQNVILVNGRTVDATSIRFNLFTLMRDLQKEASVLSQLYSLPLSFGTVQTLQRVAGKEDSALEEGDEVADDSDASALAMGTDVVRLDFRRGATGVISFLNNVEKDARYRAWPTSINGLTKPTFQLHAIRRNIYTAVFVMDLSRPASMQALASAFQLVQASLPVRIGLVFTSSCGDITEERKPEDATGKQLSKLFLAIKKTHSVSAGQAFLQQLFSQWSTQLQRSMRQMAMSGKYSREEMERIAMSSGVPLNVAKEAYAEAAASVTGAWDSDEFEEEAEEVLRDSDGEWEGYVRRIDDWVKQKGLPCPSTIMNGRVEKGIDVQQGLMHLISEELSLLQSLVRENVLSEKLLKESKQTVLGAILSSGAKIDHYHEEILHGKEWFLELGAEESSPLFKSAQQNGLSWYSAPGSSASLRSVSLFLFDDFGTVVGLNQVVEALRVLLPSRENEDTDDTDSSRFGELSTLDISQDVRITLVPNKSEFSTDSHHDRLCKFVFNLFHLLATHESDNLGTFAEILEVYIIPLVKELDESDESCAPDCVDYLLPDISSTVKSRLDPDAYKKVQELTKLFQQGKELPYDYQLYQFTKSFTSVLEASFPSSGPDRKRVAAANGRVIFFTGTESWDSADFATLCVHEKVTRGAKVLAVVQNSTIVLPDVESESSRNFSGFSKSVSRSEVTTGFVNNVVAVASSILGKYTAMDERRTLPENRLKSQHTMLSSAPSKVSVSGIDVVAILDPVSDAAQRVAPLLLTLRDQLGATVRLYYNPGTSYKENPLMSFFRFVAPGSQYYMVKGGKDNRGLKEVTADHAMFTHLPGSPVTLTTKVYTPEPWNVQESSATYNYDLDNLRLGQQSDGASEHIEIRYSLNNLLLAGQCDDSTLHQPPNGLQLILRNPLEGKNISAEPNNTVDVYYSDTLVMQNLGYFQLKANPGLWEIALAQGRASDLYEIVQQVSTGPSLGGDDQDDRLQFIGRRRPWAYEEEEEGKEEAVVDKLPVALRDFTGPIKQLRVRRRPGREKDKLLDSIEGPSGTKDEGDGSLWSQVSSMFSGSLSNADADERIHVFSLASGHLYERFLRIMMLSVVKRASRPVKFWLVENFLSQHFKHTIGYIAQRYNFEVGFVTYKWPNWLHQETEKQRIIWGYKILFLDVLFPLGVKRVITVDADQVVRADLSELWDMDLRGAPYAYTPFCTSREETLGFQFWRQGYWKDHLQGRPYHISALYVVDLVKFRKAAVGDKLRGIYDSLARDPNSLSNLDQDLPNYAQHAVPIFSLPEEWLWCETWCSDESKARAKTIDLCNNPLHKEPKLDMARRIISGPLFKENWVHLDTEVAEVLRQASLGYNHTKEAHEEVAKIATREGQQWEEKQRGRQEYEVNP